MDIEILMPRADGRRQTDLLSRGKGEEALITSSIHYSPLSSVILIVIPFRPLSSFAYLFLLGVDGEPLVGVVLKLFARAAAKLLGTLVAYLRQTDGSE